MAAKRTRSDSPSDDEARRARAGRLREQIEKLKNPVPQPGPAERPKNPRDFINEKMKQPGKKK